MTRNLIFFPLFLKRKNNFYFLLTIRNYVIILSESIKGKLIYRRDDPMRKSYEKPTILVDRNLAEGVYLASGQNAGTLNVSYMGVMDRWNGGGKGYVSVDWSGISGTVQLSIVFNDTIDQVEATRGQGSVSGKTVNVTFSGEEAGSMTVGVHVDHGTNVDDLMVTDYKYSVS